MSQSVDTKAPHIGAAQLVARETLLAKVTEQTNLLIPDATGGPRSHEVALTLVQLAAAYAAIVGSENQ